MILYKLLYFLASSLFQVYVQLESEITYFYLFGFILHDFSADVLFSYPIIYTI